MKRKRRASRARHRQAGDVPHPEEQEVFVRGTCLDEPADVLVRKVDHLQPSREELLRGVTIEVGSVEPLRNGELRCELAEGGVVAVSLVVDGEVVESLTASRRAPASLGDRIDEGWLTRVWNVVEVFSPWHDGQLCYDSRTVEDLRRAGGGRRRLEEEATKVARAIMQGDGKVAEKLLTELERWWPDAPLLHSLRVVVLWQAGAGAEARRLASATAARLPADRDATLDAKEQLALWRTLCNLGSTLGGLGEVETACALLERAHELERRLNETRAFAHPFTGHTMARRAPCVDGAVNLMRVYSRLGRREPMREVIDSVLGEAELVLELYTADAATAERLFSAAIGCLLDVHGEGFTARAEELCAQSRQLMPEPTSAELVYNWACVEARRCRWREALCLVARAVDMGFSRSHAAQDADLAGLRQHPEFLRLVR